MLPREDANDFMETTRTTIKQILLAMLVTCLTGTATLAQETVQPNEAARANGVPYDELDAIYAEIAPDVILQTSTKRRASATTAIPSLPLSERMSLARRKRR